MGILLISLFGQLSGRVGSITFARSNSGGVVRSAGRSGGLNNPRVQAQAQDFSTCVGIWRSLSRQQKSHWGQVGKSHRPPLSAYQAFLSNCLHKEEQMNNINILTSTKIIDDPLVITQLNTVGLRFDLNLNPAFPTFLFGLELAGWQTANARKFTIYSTTTGSIYYQLSEAYAQNTRRRGFFALSTKYPLEPDQSYVQLYRDSSITDIASFTQSIFRLYFLQILNSSEIVV